MTLKLAYLQNHTADSSQILHNANTVNHSLWVVQIVQIHEWWMVVKNVKKFGTMTHRLILNPAALKI